MFMNESVIPELTQTRPESTGETVLQLRTPASDDGIADVAALSVHLPTVAATGTGVIINPGGGYRILASDHEGLQMARWLNRRGIAAFVLKYRLAPGYTPADALSDAVLAMRMVRGNAAGFGLDPNRIGMLGFSAGGHLASALGTSQIENEDISSRPDFLGLIYPAIAGDLFGEAAAGQFPSTDTGVTEMTPPTFLLQTHEDNVVSPKHSLRFYTALLDHGVPAEMHVFGFGGHGLGLAPGDPDLGNWPTLFYRWLTRMGLLAGGTRARVSGHISVSGKPLYWGWVTFRAKNPVHPDALAYIGWQAAGEYQIGHTHGPKPGEYEVTVHGVCEDFSAPASGSYSMPDAALYTSTGETPGEAITVTIAEGDNRFDFDL